MSEENKEETVTPSTEIPDIAKLVNSAVTSQLKREIKKMIPELLAGMQQQTKSTADITTDTDSEDPIQKMSREIEKLKKQNSEFIKSKQEAEYQASRLKIEANIKSEIGTRVAPHIQDLLIPHLMQNINKDGELVLGDNVYDISTGVNEYLNGAGQKYLTVQPKKSNTVSKSAPTVSFGNHQNSKSTDTSAADALQKLNLLGEFL